MSVSGVQEIKDLIDKRCDEAFERGRQSVLDKLKTIVEVEKPKRAKKRKPAKSTKKGRKNPWANMTDEQRLKRINAIRKGRGLPARTSLDG